MKSTWSRLAALVGAGALVAAALACAPSAGSSPPSATAVPTGTAPPATATLPRAAWMKTGLGSGADIVGSTVAARQGRTVTIALPDFTDALAFKMRVHN